MIDKVLVLSQRGSQVWRYMSADHAHGFRRLGLDVQFCEELYKGAPTGHFWAEIVKSQVENPPDLIFQMGHLRFAYPHGMWNGDAVMATVVQDWMSWTVGVQDANAIPNAEQVALFNASRDFIFYSFPALGEAIRKQGYDPRRVHFLPPGANFDRFSVYENIEWKNEIAFPCHLGAPMTWNDEARRKRRIEPVEWLIDLGYKPALYGDGWDRIEKFKPFFKGRVQNGPELRRAYKSAMCVLQSNSDTFWHQRMFEALSCGKQVLVYETKDTPAEVPNGVYTFKSKDDIAKFMSNIERNAYDCWPYTDQHKEEFDYDVRCQEILNAVRGL